MTVRSSRLTVTFAPGFAADYALALKELVRAKVEGGEIQAPAPAAEESGEVVDLLAALARSVEKAKASRGEASEPAKASAAKGTTKKAAAKKAPAKKAAAKKKAG